MKTILTTCGTFRTGSRIADAVSEYGLALANARGLDVVTVPYVADSGSVERVQLRIGWRVDTAITTEGPSVPELVEPRTVAELTQRSQAVRHAGGDAAAVSPPSVMKAEDWDQII